MQETSENPKSSDPNRFLVATQVAELLRCDVSTVHKMVGDGRLTANKLPGKTGAYLFDRSQVEQVIAERGETRVRIPKAAS